MNQRDLNAFKYGLTIALVLTAAHLYRVIQAIPDFRNTMVDAQTRNISPGRAPASVDLDDHGLSPALPQAKKVLTQSPALKYDNTYAPNWQSKLETILHHGQSLQAVIQVIPVASIVDQHKGKTLLMEHVKIKTTLPNGDHYGYQALVNSETGEIASTWDYQRSEVNPMRLIAHPMRR